MPVGLEGPIDSSGLGVMGGSNKSLAQILSALSNRRKLLAVPYSTNSTSETDTGYDIPKNLTIVDCWILVNTAASSTTMKAGILSSETGGDAIAFLNGISVASVGIAIPTKQNTTGPSTNTVGDKLGITIKSADTTPVYAVIPTDFYPSQANENSISVIASTSTACSGYLLLLVQDMTATGYL